MEPLNCPQCFHPLIPQNKNHLSFQQCLSCGGILINLAILRKRLPPGLVKSAWRSTSSHSTSAEIDCPSCHLGFENSHPANLKTPWKLCRRCQTVWFSSLQALEKLPFNAVPKTLSSEAEQAIALLKVDEIQRKLEEQQKREALHDELDTLRQDGIFDYLLSKLLK